MFQCGDEVAIFSFADHDEAVSTTAQTGHGLFQRDDAADVLAADDLKVGFRHFDGRFDFFIEGLDILAQQRVFLQVRSDDDRGVEDDRMFADGYLVAIFQIGFPDFFTIDDQRKVIVQLFDDGNVFLEHYRSMSRCDGQTVEIDIIGLVPANMYYAAIEQTGLNGFVFEKNLCT